MNYRNSIIDEISVADPNPDPHGTVGTVVAGCGSVKPSTFVNFNYAIDYVFVSLSIAGPDPVELG